MSRRRLIVFALAVIFCTAVMVCFLSFKPRHIITPIAAETMASHVQDGDVICRLGNRMWSSWFSEFSSEDRRFSHLGIIHRKGDDITVINAEGLAVQGKDYVNEVSLEEFLEIAIAAGVYRARDLEGSRISEAAAFFKGRPFDWKFDMDEEDTLYCTELFYAVVKRIAPEMQIKTVFQKELSKTIIPLEACTQSEHFAEVFYTTAKGVRQNF
jgi:hypothetical protein